MNDTAELHQRRSRSSLQRHDLVARAVADLPFALAQYSDRQWDGPSGPLTEAVSEVCLSATGEDLGVWRYGILSSTPDVLARVAGRARIASPDGAFRYRDRHGAHHLPFECALALAQAFAASEPITVLPQIEVEARKLETELREPGSGYLLSLANRYRASWALVRQWAGADAAVAAREAENQALRELLVRTMWELRQPRADPERVAARLQRALNGG